MTGDSDFLSQVLSITGAPGIVEPDQYPNHLVDRRGYYEGRARLIVRPGSAREVSEIVSLCRKSGISIVPQGGNTGTVRRCDTGRLGRSGRPVFVTHEFNPGNRSGGPYGQR